MNNEYCILLLKWLLILFHKPKEKDLIWSRAFAPSVKLTSDEFIRRQQAEEGRAELGH